MMADFSFMFWYEEAGGHTHMRLFAGKTKMSRSKSGDLVLRNEEFAEFRRRGELAGFEFRQEGT
jgi:hypothetical protein